MNKALARSTTASLGLRSYTAAFCNNLCNAYENRSAMPADARHKHGLDLKKSDRELFEATPIGDVWIDGLLPAVWFYLMGNRHLRIPDSWHECIMKFHEEVSAKEPWTIHRRPEPHHVYLRVFE